MILPYLMRMRLDSVDEEKSMKEKTNGLLRLTALLATLMLLLSGCSAERQTTQQMQIPTVTEEPYSEAAPAQEYMAGQASVIQSNSGVIQEADLTVAYVAAPGSDLHPLRGNSRDLNSINQLVFESVVELDENLQPAPLLADRWEFDGESWIFYLREGIVFHDGSPLTAYDVVASLEDIQLNEGTSPYADRIKYIREMDALDERTLQVKGNGVGYMVLYAMTFPVVQRFSLNSTLPRGTGPYWYIRYDSFSMLRLERNPLWWKRQPSIASINCIRYDETADALTALATGQADVVATRDSAGALSRQLSDRATLDYATVTWECMVPNLHNSILSELTVRKAIMYAVDRTTLADTVYLGMAQESEVPVIPGSWLYETQSTQFNYNPERAYQLLTSSGWHDSDGDGVLDRIKDGMWEDLEITLVTYNEPGITIREEACKLIAEQLGRIGMKVNLETVTKSGMKTKFKDNTFDLALVGFNLSEVPDLTFLLGEGENGNCSEYASADMDKLLENAKEAEDADGLKSALSAVQMKAVEDLPVLGLFFRTGTLISKVSLGGLTGIRETHYLRGLEFCQVN